MITETILKQTEQRMQKCIEAFRHEMSRLRTGRAHPSLLEPVKVMYYGNETPLSQVSNITVQDARTLLISPWEKNMIPVIEKAILTSDLGLNPATSGQVIRVPLPPLSEERRKDLVKVLRAESESARVGVRNARRDANTALKESLKNRELTEDEERRLGEKIQKMTDRYTQEVDTLLVAKEADLMAV